MCHCRHDWNLQPHGQSYSGTLTTATYDCCKVLFHLDIVLSLTFAPRLSKDTLYFRNRPFHMWYWQDTLHFQSRMFLCYKDKCTLLFHINSTLLPEVILTNTEQYDHFTTISDVQPTTWTPRKLSWFMIASVSPSWCLLVFREYKGICSIVVNLSKPNHQVKNPISWLWLTVNLHSHNTAWMYTRGY